MAQLDLNKYRIYLIIGLVAIFTLFALWMRTIPASQMISDAGVALLGNDPWYGVRQVELTVANFPQYAWFDPMTHFPAGETIYWGPLFTWIISGLCILAGAAARPEISLIASWVPPLMGAAMVPVMYLIGAKLADWKTGILAAALLPVMSGAFLYRSMFGFVDHHIAEVLFGSIFVLVYIGALIYSRSHAVDLKAPDTLKMPALFAAAAGVAYLLGFYTMPTMILFALIVAVFTLVQFIIDFYRGHSSDYLVVLNVVLFAVAIIGVFAFGIQHEGIDLSLYSIGHVYAYLAVILATLALYGVARYLSGREKYYYPLALAGLGVVGTAVLFVAAPDIYSLLIANLFSFFASLAVTLTVQEAQPWSFEGAWRVFNWGLLLMAGGFATLAYMIWRDRSPAHLFAFIWSAVILFSTMAHVRYEYYLAANVALLSAVFIGFVLSAGWKDVHELLSQKGSSQRVEEGADDAPKKGKKAKKPKAAAKHGPDLLKVGMSAGVIILAGLFVASTLPGSFALAESVHYVDRNQQQYMEVLDWMSENTPETGVDYYGIYDAATYQYPTGAYGVMSWWDYGHWITYVAKRIPNANPFQRGVIGGAADFFVLTDEEKANEIRENRGTKYVITDILMDTSKFWAMATWYNSTVAEGPYQPKYLTPADSSTYQSVQMLTDRYYQTMVSRLHNFDGSMATPTEVYYVEYRDAASAGTSLPVITRAQMMDARQAVQAAETFNAKAVAGQHAAAINPQGSMIVHPVEVVPALKHYRLIYESSQNVFTGTDAPDIKYVKAFEYVPGARIKGEGIIEIDIVTNTGRNFTYRQASENGGFIVPYPTSGSPYPVKALSSYRIAGTSATFEVTEEDIQQGRIIT